jgi:hypothetical protein
LRADGTDNDRYQVKPGSADILGGGDEVLDQRVDVGIQLPGIGDTVAQPLCSQLAGTNLLLDESRALLHHAADRLLDGFRNSWLRVAIAGLPAIRRPSVAPDVRACAPVRRLALRIVAPHSLICPFRSLFRHVDSPLGLAWINYLWVVKTDNVFERGPF